MAYVQWPFATADGQVPHFESSDDVVLTLFVDSLERDKLVLAIESDEGDADIALPRATMGKLVADLQAWLEGVPN